MCLLVGANLGIDALKFGNALQLCRCQLRLGCFVGRVFLGGLVSSLLSGLPPFTVPSTVSRRAASWLGLAAEMPTVESELLSDTESVDMSKPGSSKPALRIAQSAPV